MLRSFLLLAIVSLPLMAAQTAGASSASQYAALRQKLHCNRHLSYTAVQSDPETNADKVLELRGTVNGVSETDKSVTIILTLPDKQTPTLDLPLSEATLLRDTTLPRISLLVQVASSNIGNQVSLKVLSAVRTDEIEAYDAQSTAKDRTAQRRAEQTRRANERWHQEVLRSGPRNGSKLSSRGGLSRPDVSIPPITGQIADYQRALGARVRDCFPYYYDFIARHNRKLDGHSAAQIAYYLLAFADKYDVDPRLVTAMIVAESDFDPRSTSSAGAMGLGQLMPNEAKELGLNNPYDIQQNLKGSVHFLRARLDNFSSSAAPGGALSFEQIRLALAAYNAGVGAVKKYHGIPPYRETQGYVKRIEKLYRQFCGLGS